MRSAQSDRRGPGRGWVAGGWVPICSVPVYSLYSETREPTADMLRNVDVLVVDLQDIGARIYTYIYTLANCMRAAARHGIPVVVCDRPNLIGGVQVEAGLLAAGFRSAVFPSIRCTAKRANRPLTCCGMLTSWSSTCRTSALGSTPTSTHWPTACGRRRATAFRSWYAIGPIRSAGSRSRVGCWRRG